MPSVSKTALKIALLYSLVGSVWILFSDQLTVRLISNPEEQLAMSVAKGWLFILVTTVCLYAVLQRYLQRLQQVNQDLATAYEEMRIVQDELQDRFSELQEASQDLQVSQERFYSLFCGMGEGVALHEMVRDSFGQPVDYRIVEVNPRYEAVLGLKRESVTGQTARAAYGTSEAPFLSEYSQVVANQQPTVMEVYFAPLDRHFLISVTPWGRDGFATVFSDTTDRKQTEQKLREREITFRMVADFTYDWEFWIGPRGDLLYMSPSAERLSGYRRECFIDRPELLMELVYEDDRGRVQSHMMQEEQTAPAPRHLDFRLKNAAGQIRWLSMHYLPVFDDNGAALGRRYSCRDITDRIEMEAFIRLQSEDLRRLNERFSLAAESAGIGVWELDVDSGKLFWDETMHELYGLAPGEFDGDVNAWLRVVHPDDRQEAFREYRQALQGETEYDSEFRVTRPDQSVHYIKAFGRVARQGKPGSERMTGVNYDITRSKVAEVALRRSEARYRILTESLRDAVWVLDVRDLRFTYSSPAVRRLQNLMPETMLNPKIDDVLFPEDRDAIIERVRSRAEDFLAGRQPAERYYVEEIRQPGRDGSVWMEVISRYFLNEENGRVELWGVSQDITQRKQTERALQDSEARYRAILQQSHDAIAVVDMDSKRFLEVNACLLQLLGYSEQEIQQMTILQVTEDPEFQSDEFYAGILSGQEKAATRRQLRHKQGRVVEVELSASVIQFAGKQMFLFDGRDVTEERKMQEKIRQEVSIAAALQKYILPRDFQDVLLTVEAVYSPYHVVSGDFYDYAWNPNHQRFSGYVLDISGHGVASSLQGIAVSAYFREVLASPMRLAAKLNWINRHVLRYFTEDTYAAAIYFEFDFTTKVLTYATAGIYGFLASTAELPAIVMQAGSFIGILDDAEYGEGSISFASGDSFYFMSDGIFDQISRDRSLTVKDFAGTVDWLRKLATNEGRRDDCCALCIRINGRPSFPVCFELRGSGEYERIRSRIRELLREVAGDQVARLDVAIGEALNNSVRESMDVRIKINLYGPRLAIRIRDSGEGFDGNRRVTEYLDRQDRLFEERMMDEGGRGIYIMAAWMDRVLYNRAGNEVLLVKRLPLVL
ncbi:MAG TPA: PAS domain S-box protein [Patescibacteria group bacterium]|nr:PAS domain S-box protein [Patescibacteria group bacterium]